MIVQLSCQYGGAAQHPQIDSEAYWKPGRMVSVVYSRIFELLLLQSVLDFANFWGEAPQHFFRISFHEVLKGAIIILWNLPIHMHYGICNVWCLRVICLYDLNSMSQSETKNIQFGWFQGISVTFQWTPYSRHVYTISFDAN